MPDAIGVAVEVPSRLIVCVLESYDSYPGLSQRYFGQAPKTASPRALYFSSPSKGGLNVDCAPKPSAEPIEKIPCSRAGKVIG
jgi:hypothetical protein